MEPEKIWDKQSSKINPKNVNNNKLSNEQQNKLNNDQKNTLENKEKCNKINLPSIKQLIKKNTSIRQNQHSKISNRQQQQQLFKNLRQHFNNSFSMSTQQSNSQQKQQLSSLSNSLNSSIMMSPHIEKYQISECSQQIKQKKESYEQANYIKRKNIESIGNTQRILYGKNKGGRLQLQPLQISFTQNKFLLLEDHSKDKEIERLRKLEEERYNTPYIDKALHTDQTNQQKELEYKKQVQFVNERDIKKQQTYINIDGYFGDYILRYHRWIDRNKMIPKIHKDIAIGLQLIEPEVIDQINDDEADQQKKEQLPLNSSTNNMTNIDENLRTSINMKTAIKTECDTNVLSQVNNSTNLYGSFSNTNKNISLGNTVNTSNNTDILTKRVSRVLTSKLNTQQSLQATISSNKSPNIETKQIFFNNKFCKEKQVQDSSSHSDSQSCNQSFQYDPDIIENDDEELKKIKNTPIRIISF